MLFSEFIVSEAIQTELAAVSKRQIICQLVQGLADAGVVGRSPRRVGEAVVEREQVASTALAPKIAIPHAKHPAVARPVTAIGVCRAGVEFDSLDGGKTHVFFLTVSPPDRWYDHQQILKKISAHVLSDAYFTSALLQAIVPEDVSQILRDADEQTRLAVGRRNSRGSGCDVAALWTSLDGRPPLS